MKFKSIGMKAAVLATVAVGSAVVGAAPSHAMSLSSGGTIDLSPVVSSNAIVKFKSKKSSTITGLNFVGANAGKVLVTSATGGFSSYLGSGGTIKNLVSSGGVFGPVDDFLSINPDLKFDLSSVVASLSADKSAADFVFQGAFNNAMGEILGSGTLTTQVNFKDGKDQPSSFSLTADASAVPTPALLPGLVGMGVAALRKRKSAEETVEEAVEV